MRPQPVVRWDPPVGAPPGTEVRWGPGAPGPNAGGTPASGAGWGAYRSIPDRPRTIILPSARRLTLVAAATGAFAFVVILTLATRATVALGLPEGVVGTPDMARSLGTDLALMAILVADAVALRRVLAGWLERGAAVAGGDLLADRAADPERGLPATTGNARRHATVRALIALGVVLVVAGAGAWITPLSLVARAGLLLAIAGAACLLGAVGLVPGVQRAAERAADIADVATRGGTLALTPDISPRLGAVAAALGAVAAMTIGVTSVPSDAGVACAAPSTWTCASVTVRADHGGTAAVAPVMRVSYAVLPAERPSGTPREVLVYATGGPGSSGLTEAAWLERELPEAVRDRFDVVVFDPRGTGGSDGLECPRAARRFLTSPTTRESAEAFARACPAEAGVTGDGLRAYATAQVIEDLDAIRATLGVDRITLVGSSYGTRVAQEYAVAHPDRVRALLLDAPIDRSLTAAQLWGYAAGRFEDVIDQTFASCAADFWCSTDLPDPVARLERIRSRLEGNGVIRAAVPTASGVDVTLEFDRSQFESAVADAMYEPATRMLLLRALAASGAGDDRPLAALVGLDPTARGDRGRSPFEESEFPYYATWCADERVSPTGQDDDADGFIAAALEAAGEEPPQNEVALTLLPCAWWGAQPAPGPEPVDVAGVPTLILTASADPITRVEEARALHGRIAGSVLIETNGGAHGTFLAPEDCPGEHVLRFLLEAEVPDRSAIVCDGDVTWGYLPLAGEDTTDPLTAVEPLEGEIYGSAEYLWWDGSGELSIACLEGGSMRFRPADEPNRFEITYIRCRWVFPGPEFTGKGWLDWSSGAMEFTVLGDGEDEGALTYQRDDEGGRRLTGTWNGDKVDVTD